MRGMVFKDSNSDQLTNLRPLLEIEASYHLAVGEYEKAKDAYRREDIFTIAERNAAIRRIEIEQSYKRVR
jgi:hypothetical protein